VFFFLTVFALFFFFRDGERMLFGVRDLIPLDPAIKDQIMARFSETLTAVVLGTAATAVAQGVLGGNRLLGPGRAVRVVARRRDRLLFAAPVRRPAGLGRGGGLSRHRR
jgi:hypothetical protein